MLGKHRGKLGISNAKSYKYLYLKKEGGKLRFNFKIFTVFIVGLLFLELLALV